MNRPDIAPAAATLPLGEPPGEGWLNRAWHSTALRLALLALIVYNINLRSETSMDTYPTRYVPVSLVTQLNLDLDEFAFLHHYPEWYHADADAIPYYVQFRRGHYVSTYPVMPAILSVVVYALPVWLLKLAHVPISLPLVTLLSKLAASAAVAASVGVLYLGVRRLKGERPALWIALIYAFATCSWSSSSQGLWQTAWSQPLLAAALYGFIRARESQSQWLIGAGLALALSVACRPPNAVIAAVMMIYVLHQHVLRPGGREGVRSLLRFIAFPLLIGTLLVLYQLYYFGSLSGGYSGEMNRLEHSARAGFAFSYPSLTAFWGLLASPSRGLLVLSPVLLFSVAAMAIALWRRRDWLMVYTALATVALLVLYSTWSVWYGAYGYGYRFLVDLLPGLCLLLVVVWDRLVASAALRTLLIATVAFSIFVQAVGAFCFPSDWYSKPVSPSDDRARLWDWSDTELMRCLRQGPHLPPLHLLKGGPARGATDH
jgi:hypothetical protein